MDIPRSLRNLLRKSPGWNASGVLQLKPKWSDLKDAARDAGARAGIYALGLRCGIQYDHGASRIIYIGSSESLISRLTQHRSKSNNEVIELVRQHFGANLLGAFWLFPGSSTSALRMLEAESLWSFEHLFGTVPVANLDIPETELGGRYTGFLRVSPCDPLGAPLSLDQFAARVGRILDRSEKSPIGNPRSVSVSFGLTLDGRLGQLNVYRAAGLMTPEEVEQRKRREVEDLSWLTEKHVAVWSEQKMRSVLEICRVLERDRRRSRSTTIHRFVAPQREVPQPHSWGEVALLQGRLIAGEWFPREKHVVKILRGNELLGDARLVNYSCSGHDKSDLPQVATRRDWFWDLGDSDWLQSDDEDDRDYCERLRKVMIGRIEETLRNAMQGA